MKPTGVPKALWPRVQAGIIHMLEVSSPEELTNLLRENDRQLASLVAYILAAHSPADGEPSYISEEERDLVSDRLKLYPTSLRENFLSAIDGRLPEPCEIQLWTQSQLR